MDSTLTSAAHDLRQDARRALTDLRETLGTAHSDDALRSRLRVANEDLDGLFLLVVLGEFNAGKSTLINALLEANVMAEGVTPTTDRVTVLRYGEDAATSESNGVVTRTLPLPALRDLAIVDTPGTNTVLSEHQALTEHFMPRADQVLFVTSADRPFTESERRFLEAISAWGKRVLLVVNKMDLLDDAPSGALADVTAFVTRHARDTLHEPEPLVVPIAGRAARRAQQDGNAERLAASGLPDLERTLRDVLNDEERIRRKLASPIAVASRVAHEAQRDVENRLELLAGDLETLDMVRRHRRHFEREMQREAQTYLARVKTTLVEVERRGEVFLDETVRIGNLLALLRPDQTRERFLREVLRDADAEIDEAMQDMVDWFLTRNASLWEDVIRDIAARRIEGDRIVGDVGGRFHVDRRALMRALRDRADAVRSSYDDQAEAERLATSLHRAVVQTGLLQVSGVGLGAAIVAFVSSTALDVTGISVGLAVVGLGALVLPRRRARAKRELHAAMQRLRDGLSRDLEAQLSQELARTGEQLAAAIGPYVRFVDTERERFETLIATFAANIDALAALEQRVAALGRTEPGAEDAAVVPGP